MCGPYTRTRAHALKSTRPSAPARAPKVPIPVASKYPIGERPNDPTCPYWALRRHYRQRAAAVPAALRDTAPLFVGPDGMLPIDTQGMREAVRQAAVALGKDPLQFGASAPRRGGATDLKAALGLAAGKKLTQQRGRWWSDIDDIYSRASVAEHVMASTALSSASDTLTLEQIVVDWVQPARFRR